MIGLGAYWLSLVGQSWTQMEVGRTGKLEVINQILIMLGLLPQKVWVNTILAYMV